MKDAVVDSDLVGDGRWVAIFEMAQVSAVTAALTTQPTPVTYVQGGTDSEGVCGGAYAWLSGRDPMAKWLLRSGHGSRDRPGVSVSTNYNGLSWERARAAARAFCEVLNANGVECDARAWVD